MADYPGAIPSFPAMPTTLAGGGSAHTDRHADIEAEVIAIATALGPDFADTFDRIPKGPVSNRRLVSDTNYTYSGPPVDVFAGSTTLVVGRFYTVTAYLLFTATSGTVWTGAIRTVLGTATSEVLTVTSSGTVVMKLEEPMFVPNVTSSVSRYIRLTCASNPQTITVNSIWSRLVILDHGRT